MPKDITSADVVANGTHLPDSHLEHAMFVMLVHVCGNGLTIAQQSINLNQTEGCKIIYLGQRMMQVLVD